MVREYKVDQIGEVAGGGTPSTANAEYWNGDIPWISPKDLTGYSSVYISCGESSITKEGLNKSGTRLLPKDTVLFSSRAPIGYVAIAQNPLCTNQGFKSIICNKSIIDPLYLYYYIKANLDYFKLWGSGATFPEISGSAMRRIKVSIIDDIGLQKKISTLLYSYDNLIEINNKRIKILEQMAENLYKEWFVRFRFPGHETAEFENGLPKGWKIEKVANYAKIKSGFPFKSEWWQSSGCPVVKIKDIGNGTLDIANLDCVSEEHTTKAKSFLLKEGDLVIAMTGATIGKIGLVPRIENLYTNQRVGKFFLGKNAFEKMPILYCLFSQPETVEMILCLSGASSAQPNISPDQLESIKFFYEENLVKEFNKKTTPIFKEILELRYKNQNLATQRDLLLPRLMSGKIEIK